MHNRPQSLLASTAGQHNSAHSSCINRLAATPTRHCPVNAVPQRSCRVVQRSNLACRKRVCCCCNSPMPSTACTAVATKQVTCKREQLAAAAVEEVLLHLMHAAASCQSVTKQQVLTATERQWLPGCLENLLRTRMLSAAAAATL
jgi:hypothetical protein